MCSCRCKMFLDGSDYTYQSCEPDHVPWIKIIGLEMLQQKIREMRTVKPRQIERYRELLLWKTEDSHSFMRDEFLVVGHYGEDGVTITHFTKERLFIGGGTLSPWQYFHDRETMGVDFEEGSYNNEVEDPDLTLDLLQSKCLREFTIDQWMTNDRDIYPIWPEEYMSHPGMTKELFVTLFHREPNELILESLKTVP